MATAIAFAESGTSPTGVIDELRAAWQEYQTVERRGLAFGQRLHELRAASSAQGNHQGNGFLPLLQQAGIPQRTAYYWIHSYELSVGFRKPREKEIKPSATPAEETEIPSQLAPVASVTVSVPDSTPAALDPRIHGWKSTRAIEPVGPAAPIAPNPVELAIGQCVRIDGVGYVVTLGRTGFPSLRSVEDIEYDAEQRRKAEQESAYRSAKILSDSKDGMSKTSLYKTYGRKAVELALKATDETPAPTAPDLGDRDALKEFLSSQSTASLNFSVYSKFTYRDDVYEFSVEGGKPWLSCLMSINDYFGTTPRDLPAIAVGTQVKFGDHLYVTRIARNKDLELVEKKPALRLKKQIKVAA